MLIDFSFSNFLSFQGEQQFSMQRMKSEAAKNARDGWGHNELSTVTGIYGANASGKSSALSAITYLFVFVADGLSRASAEQGTGRTAFALDSVSVDEPSDFLVLYYGDDGKKYQFDLSVDDEFVVYEALRVWNDSNRPSLLYKRNLTNTQDGLKTTFHFGPSFKGSKKVYESVVRSNVSLLSVLGAMDNEQTRSAFDFFADGFFSGDAGHYELEYDFMKKEMRQNPKYCEAIRVLLHSSDLGIDDLKLDTGQLDAFIDAFREFEKSEADSVAESASGLLRSDENRDGFEDAGFSSDDKMSFVTEYLKKNLELRLPSAELLFGHKTVDAIRYFTIDEESRGTTAILAFLSVALKCLSQRSIMLVDEIDSSLHPSFVNSLLELFLDPETNPYESQLIFTTHDIALLMRVDGDSPLARDQIWLAEKDLAGVSNLFPLTVFGIRAEENIARNYINGVYGAVPYPQLRSGFVKALSIVDESLGDDNGKN